MDVGGALLECVAQDMVERLDDGRGGRVELLMLGGEEFLVAEVDGGSQLAASCFSAVLRLVLRS